MIIFIEKLPFKNAMMISRGEKTVKEQAMLKAMNYIDENINQSISLYDLSREAGFSVPHFYRLFRRLTGDSVGAYILRRKITLAARDLAESNRSIASIAFEYGFESHDVFTRAFTRVYGMSPKKYRHSNCPPPLKRLSVTENQIVKDEQQMKYSLIQSDEFFVVGMVCYAQIWDKGGDIGRLWSDFLARVDEIQKAKSPMTMYGICEHETCSHEHFKYMAAIGVSDDAEAAPGMVIRLVRAQKFIQASVPESIATPDAYAGTIGYAKSLGYEIDAYDNIEVYDEVFHDPYFYSFKLLIPVK
jgi:AraC family transcriptional regulator